MDQLGEKLFKGSKKSSKRHLPKPLWRKRDSGEMIICLTTKRKNSKESLKKRGGQVVLKGCRKLHHHSQKRGGGQKWDIRKETKVDAETSLGSAILRENETGIRRKEFYHIRGSGEELDGKRETPVNERPGMRRWGEREGGEEIYG